MPKALERKLAMQARKKGFSKKRAGAYVYGTLRKTGWKPTGEKSGLRKLAMQQRVVKKKRG